MARYYKQMLELVEERLYDYSQCYREGECLDNKRFMYNIFDMYEELRTGLLNEDGAVEYVLENEIQLTAREKARLPNYLKQMFDELMKEQFHKDLYQLSIRETTQLDEELNTPSNDEPQSIDLTRDIVLGKEEDPQ